MMSFNSGRPRRRALEHVEPARPAEAGRPAAVDVPVARTDDDDPTFGWHASSLDLRLGCHVSEKPMDTLPGELLDSFFRR